MQLQILKLIVEELLARLGMYASSLPIDEYCGGRFVATAHRIFMVIPCGAVRDQHVMIAANAYAAGSLEWCCMMQGGIDPVQHAELLRNLLGRRLQQWERYAARGHTK